MRILGLDTATKTGWALVDDGRIVESGMSLTSNTPTIA